MDSKTSLYTILAVSLFLQVSSAANILFFYGVSGYSHRISSWPLIKSLADRGHHITFFSGHKSKSSSLHYHPNITDIAPSDLLTRMDIDIDWARVRLEGGVKAAENLWFDYAESGVKLCEVVTSDPAILTQLTATKFDLVVINGMFNDCAFALAWKHKAATITYAASAYFPWYSETYGYPDENYPEFRYHLPPNMSFLQEVSNALQPLYWKIYRNYYYFPKLEKIVRPALNVEDMPSLEEMDKRTSMVFVNTHYSEEYPRALPPWILQIAGMHLEDDLKPLPKNILNFINKWEDGFIYFSFGTYMKLPLLPQGHRDAIFGAIRKFPNIGFILKWNGGDIPKDLPENVLTAEWMDQQAILAHPKVRAFIAHAGLLGIQEAVYHGVPMIVFPIFSEQDYNAVRLQSSERGIMMEISELTEEKLENAIQEILSNEKYGQNMKKTSKIFLDRPQKPVDTAVFWMEYVLRHKNSNCDFLKPLGLNKPWYERRLLHVWGFIFGLGLVFLSLVFYVVRFCILKLFVNSRLDKLKVS